MNKNEKWKSSMDTMFKWFGLQKNRSDLTRLSVIEITKTARFPLWFTNVESYIEILILIHPPTNHEEFRSLYRGYKTFRSSETLPQPKLKCLIHAVGGNWDMFTITTHYVVFVVLLLSVRVCCFGVSVVWIMSSVVEYPSSSILTVLLTCRIHYEV